MKSDQRPLGNVSLIAIIKGFLFEMSVHLLLNQKNSASNIPLIRRPFQRMEMIDRAIASANTTQCLCDGYLDICNGIFTGLFNCQ